MTPMTDESALSALGRAADYVRARLRTDDVDAARLAHALAVDAAEIRDRVLAGRPDDGSREPPWLS